MRIGCQVNMWKNDDVEQVIPAAGETGVKGIELFVKHIKPYYARPDALAELLRSAGLALSGAYFNSGGFIDPDAEESVLQEAHDACAFLAKVGAGYLILNGGVHKGQPPRTFSEADFGQLARVFNRIGADARDSGVKAVTHPHMGCMVETPADVSRLLDSGLDRELVGLCVHAAHQLKAGADPYEIYEKHASWVRYVHAGDANADGKGAFLEEGVLDQQRLMKPLLEAGYDGWVIIECGRPGTEPEEYAANAAAYLTAQWPDVGWH